MQSLIFYQRLGLILLAAILFALAGLQYNTPIAAWLYPVLFLFICRKSRSYKPLLALFVASWFAGVIKVWGLLADDMLSNLALAFVLSVVCFLPFLVDKYLCPRLRGIKASLVFPCALVFVEFACSFSPFGAITSLATTQIYQLDLIQLASVTGMFGVSFMMGWAASCAATFLLRTDGAQERRRVFLACVSVYLLICAYGGLRLHLLASESATLRVAMPKTDEGACSLSEWERAMQAAIASKADIIQFHEAAFVCDDCLPQDLLQRAQEMAQQHNLTILLPLITADEAGDKQQNKILIIDERGELVDCYYKHNTVPFVESSRYSTASAQPSLMDTRHGRMASVICFDLDYPSFMREAGKKRADFIMAPSFDWDPLTSFHTASLKYRAIENGASLVRNTHTGVSAAYDYLGNQLVYTNHYCCDETRYLLVADIPSQGVQTIYSLWGDWFNYACIAGVFVLCIMGKRSRDGGVACHSRPNFLHRQEKDS